MYKSKTEKLIESVCNYLNLNVGSYAQSATYSEGKWWSYNTLIAKLVDNQLLIDTSKYSVTTSRQQNCLIEQAQHLGIEVVKTGNIN